MPDRPLAGTVALVTGAAGRLGGRTVHRLLADGASVAAVVRSDDAAARLDLPAGADAAVFTADLTDEDAVAACFEAVHDRFGRLDALVHTVGMWGMQPLAETSLDDWRRMMDVNLTSAFLCFREAARRMETGGRLIAMASAQGADRGAAQQAAYSAAKAGVVRLVEAVAEEYGPRGIAAHAVAPSMILFGGEDAETAGVPADDLTALFAALCRRDAPPLSGAVLRAYGSARWQ